MALLTVADFRAFVSSDLGDGELQLLLDAAEQAIDAEYGPVGAPVTETVDGGFTYLFLRRRAAAITKVTETSVDVDTILAADDYRIRSDGVSVKRLWSGTNPRDYWGEPVAVEYTAVDDVADRKRVQKLLVEQDLNSAPGVSTRERIGDWEEEQSASSVWNYETERASILATLVGNPAGHAPGFA